MMYMKDCFDELWLQLWKPKKTQSCTVLITCMIQLFHCSSTKTGWFDLGHFYVCFFSERFTYCLRSNVTIDARMMLKLFAGLASKQEMSLLKGQKHGGTCSWSPGMDLRQITRSSGEVSSSRAGPSQTISWLRPDASQRAARELLISLLDEKANRCISQNVEQLYI